MEPLRGGRLANKLPKDAVKVIDRYKVKRSPAEWAFRWLWNQPEVTCVLSGMNSMDIPGIFAAYNCRYADSKFWGLVDYVVCTSVRREATAASNCVKCGKCEQHCPQGIKIRDELETVRKKFERPLYKIGTKILKVFMKY